MIRISLIALVGLALSGCDGPGAPDEAGVCWRAPAQGAGSARFTPLARDVTSLEDCAVILEAARLDGQLATNGAYQGYFLFVDAGQMSSASHAGGLHYPIFQPPQRAAVDRDLRRLLKARGGKLPDAQDITLEHH